MVATVLQGAWLAAVIGFARSEAWSAEFWVLLVASSVVCLTRDSYIRAVAQRDVWREVLKDAQRRQQEQTDRPTSGL